MSTMAAHHLPLFIIYTLPPFPIYQSFSLHFLTTKKKSCAVMGSFIRATEMLQVLAVMAFFLAPSSAANFYEEVYVNWGGPRAQIQNAGQVLTLSLDNISGSGFESYSPFLYGRFDMQIKLVPGNSAGTVTTFYLSSQGPGHDEVDFEFLGNSSGQPYTIHTNVYAQDVGNREQRFLPWFDPTATFHTYTILWNSQRIIFMVDNTPIRVFNNNAAKNVPFPTNQPMKLYGSIWNGDEWATQGGRVKIDWAYAPFTATYQNYTVDGCRYTASGNSCNGSLNNQPWQTQGLDDNQRAQLQFIQKNYVIYNYCTDFARFPQGLPTECSLPMF